MDHQVSKKNKRSFELNGVYFNNIADACKKMNLNVCTVYQRIFKGMTVEQALTTPNTRDIISKDHLGNVFKSISDMCKYHKVERSTFDMRFAQGKSLRESLTGKKLCIKNKWFKSKGEICRYYKIPYRKMMWLINGKKLTLEQAIDKLLQNKN